MQNEYACFTQETLSGYLLFAINLPFPLDFPKKKKTFTLVKEREYFRGTYLSFQ